MSFLPNFAKPGSSKTASLESSDNKAQQPGLYDVLGVSKNVSEQEMKEAYKTLALKYHPDRNPGDAKAQEQFQKIAVAYSVLSDPIKRQQYDLSGGRLSAGAADGVDMTEVKGFGRFVSALLSKVGVPVHTVIPPKVLIEARELSLNYFGDIETLQPGFPNTGYVSNGEAYFFRLHMEQKFSEKGVIIQCKSSTASRFKFVLFDREGEVRMLRESRHNGGCTTADFFFVPFHKIDIAHTSDLSVRMGDRSIPTAFHYLNSLETQGSSDLQSGDHLLCIYGDDFYLSVRYRLNFFLLSDDCAPTITKLNLIEPRLINKKREMAEFQREYMDLKTRFEMANQRLKLEDAKIKQLLKEREESYVELFSVCTPPSQQVAAQDTKSKRLVDYIFGRM